MPLRLLISDYWPPPLPLDNAVKLRFPDFPQHHAGLLSAKSYVASSTLLLPRLCVTPILTFQNQRLPGRIGKPWEVSSNRRCAGGSPNVNPNGLSSLICVLRWKGEWVCRVERYASVGLNCIPLWNVFMQDLLFVYFT